MQEQNQLAQTQTNVVELEKPTVQSDVLERAIAKYSFEDEQEKQEFREALSIFAGEFRRSLEREDQQKAAKANVHRLIGDLIAEIDNRVSERLNEVMHHPEFQKLEASWTGLQKMIKESNTDETLKIYVLNATKEELLDDLDDREFDQSALFKRIYSERFDMFRGEPYGVIVGDYEFGRNAPDMRLLKKVSQISAVAQAPFISSTSPKLFSKGWKDFTMLTDARSLGELIADDPELADWREFRAYPDSRYVALVMPHVLMRLPYGEENPARGFTFKEEVDGKDHRKYLWGNAVYSYAIRIARSFHDYGWCVAIRGEKTGGLVEDLPVHTFKTDHGTTVPKCPAEVAIPFQKENELSNLGFVSLVWGHNSPVAAFYSGQSCKAPEEFADKASTENSQLSARLPYIFAISRVTHYLQRILYRKVGEGLSAIQLEKELKDWLRQYANASDFLDRDTMARYPFRNFDIKVNPIPGKIGFFAIDVMVEPRIAFEGAWVKMSLVSQVPPRQ